MSSSTRLPASPRFSVNDLHHDEGTRRTMLAPVAYSEDLMPSLQLARSSRWTRRIARVLFVLLIATVIVMAFAPWQQSVTGSGNVVAYDPNQRQQVLEARIKGLLVRLGEHVYEGARVKKGEFIAEIRDLDDGYTDRLQLKLETSEAELKSAENQVEASEQVLAAVRRVVDSTRQQFVAYELIRSEVEQAQNAYVEMAQKKVNAETQAVLEAEAAVPQLQAQYDRSLDLYRSENFSLQKVQEVERKLAEAKAKVAKAEAYLEAAQAELEGKKRDRQAKLHKASADIDYYQAALEKAQGDVSKAQSDLEKAKQGVNKAQKLLLDAQTQVARQSLQVIEAPFDGYIINITPNLRTQVMKEGDPICTLVPDTPDRAVQVWLDGNDAPLVSTGRHVRLQFEGWPAIQFAGWPSIAVGTFGGDVISVDAVDNGKGKFRCLIRPDSDSEDWPEGKFLRQGVRTNAWVLLDEVPLWFEVWRKLNGFPPTVDVEDSGVGPKSDDGKAKK